MRKEKLPNYSDKKYESIPFRDPDFELFSGTDKDSAKVGESFSSAAFHEEIEIKYFYEGNALLVIGDEVILTRPGDIVIVNPYELHRTLPSEKYRGKYHLFDVGLDFLSTYAASGLNLRRCFIDNQLRVNNLVRGDEKLQSILSLAASEMKNGHPYYKPLVTGLMAEFFSLLLRTQINTAKRENAADNTSDRKRIAPAWSYIHVNYHKKITNEELAALCHMSKYHFCRVFRKALGVTVSQYLQSYRIKIADIMVHGSDTELPEIGFLCGFEDTSYFYRTYKKIKGITPKQTRSQMKATLNAGKK